ncbi:putative non-specific serine/threonine protein kinase [Helianthus anomalus]
MAFLVVLLVLFFTKPGFSQKTDSNNTNVIAMRCGRNELVNQPNFIKNRNSTFRDLRAQLLDQKVLYARAQALSSGDSVFAAVQCRNYLSTDQCVACFDECVSELLICNSGNSGFVSFDNCYVRYEDNAGFYNDPYVMADADQTPTLTCGNQSASQPTVFNQVIDAFLSDITKATPKTSNFYVASTRQITSENKTVYATAQCVQGMAQDSCQTCMNSAYDTLNDCFPNTQGKFFHLACFARYSDTPFFNVNQTIDITNLLKGDR